MTKKVILAERKFCAQQIKMLQDEIMSETDQSIALTKLEEMTAWASRAIELDTMYTKMVSDEHDRTVIKLLNHIMKRV